MQKEHKILIYSTTHCPYCKAAKEFFNENNVKYKEINVEEDEKAAHEMVKKSGQLGVPVIDIDGQIIIGFDKPALKKALDIK